MIAVCGKKINVWILLKNALEIFAANKSFSLIAINLCVVAVHVVLQILADITQLYSNAKMLLERAAEALAVHTQELMQIQIRYANAHLT